MRFLLAPILLLGASCTTAGLNISSETYSVPGLTEAFDTLDDQEVRVRGWANGCNAKRTRCGLFQDRRRAKKGVIDGWALVIKQRPGFSMPESGQVLLRAKVVVTCNRAEFICLERTGHLEPITVRLENM